jgi:hypothetical protein
MELAIYIAILVISIYVSVSMAPKPETPRATAFEDIDFPQVDEGTPQAVIFGDCWSGDWTVLAVGNYRTTAIRSKGGKK